MSVANFKCLSLFLPHAGGHSDASIPPLSAPPHGSTDKVAELRQLTAAQHPSSASQGQQQQQYEGVSEAAEAAAVSVLSSVLDVNDYSARSLIDQEPALLEISEKQLKVRKNPCGWRLKYLE